MPLTAFWNQTLHILQAFNPHCMNSRNVLHQKYLHIWVPSTTWVPLAFLTEKTDKTENEKESHPCKKMYAAAKK